VKPAGLQPHPLLHSIDFSEGEETRYRRRAEDCLSRAMIAKDGEQLIVWLDLAARWNELAGRAERRRFPTQRLPYAGH
jgi:hypothetical protein